MLRQLSEDTKLLKRRVGDGQDTFYKTPLLSNVQDCMHGLAVPGLVCQLGQAGASNNPAVNSLHAVTETDKSPCGREQVQARSWHKHHTTLTQSGPAGAGRPSLNRPGWPCGHAAPQPASATS